MAQAFVEQRRRPLDPVAIKALMRDLANENLQEHHSSLVATASHKSLLKRAEDLAVFVQTGIRNRYERALQDKGVKLAVQAILLEDRGQPVELKQGELWETDKDFKVNLSIRILPDFVLNLLAGFVHWYQAPEESSSSSESSSSEGSDNSESNGSGSEGDGSESPPRKKSSSPNSSSNSSSSSSESGSSSGSSSSSSSSSSESSSSSSESENNTSTNSNRENQDAETQ